MRRPSFFASRRSRAAASAVALASLIVASAACTAGYGSDATTSGDLGNGTFRYICTGPVDPTCGVTPGASFDPSGIRSSTSTAARFPSALAFGGTFHLDFVPNSTATARVTPASPAFFTAQTQVFTGIRAGTSALIATAAANGRVIDFTHVTVSVPRTIRVVASDGSPTRQRAVSSRTAFGAVAAGSDGQFLGGTISPLWESSNPTVARVVDASGVEVPSDRGASIVYLQGVSSGTVKLSARYAGREDIVELNVGAVTVTDAGTRDSGDASLSTDAGDAGLDATSASDAGTDASHDGGADGN